VIDHAFDVDLISRPLEQKAARRVPENVEIPVVHSAQQALGLGFFVQGEPGMNRAYGVIKLFQQIVRIVESPVRKNINFTGLTDFEYLSPEDLDLHYLISAEGIRHGNRETPITL